MIRHSMTASVASSGKPRASGDDPDRPAEVSPGKSVNPARAGMIPIVQQCGFNESGNPRASGDDPMYKMATSLDGA